MAGDLLGHGKDHGLGCEVRAQAQSAEQKRGDGLTQDLDGPHLSVHLCLLELKGLWRLQHLPAPLLPAGLWPLGSSVSPQNPTSPSIQAFTRAAPHAQDGPLLSLERSGLFTGLPLGLRIPPAARRPPLCNVAWGLWQGRCQPPLLLGRSSLAPSSGPSLWQGLSHWAVSEETRGGQQRGGQQRAGQGRCYIN